jgi:hypothetical protein
VKVNPLVAGPVDVSSSLGGTLLLESVWDLSQALDSGSWLEVGLAGLSTAMDTVAAVSDPLGQLIGAGLGWLMEHMEPLRGWLNDLTGDAGAVAGFALTWDNIAKQMTGAGDELERLVRADLEGMTGAGVGAYALYAKDLTAHIRGLAGSSSSVASGLRTCSTIVKVVHDLVRDVLAELVGAAISWAAEIVLTVGLGTPWVVEQVTTRVSALATRVGTKVTEVISSAKKLKQLIEALKEAIESLARNLRNAKPGSVHGPDVPGGTHFSGGRIRPRPKSDLEVWDWADGVYDVLRTDPDFVSDLARHNPDLDPSDIERAMKHVLEDEQLLGGGIYGPEHVGRFDADPDMADAFLRLRNGQGTDVDRLLLQHEIAESAFMRDHPGAAYQTAHQHATGVADWEGAVGSGKGGS